MGVAAEVVVRSRGSQQPGLRALLCGVGLWAGRAGLPMQGGP